MVSVTSILERRSANGVGMMPGKDEIRENFWKGCGQLPPGGFQPVRSFTGQWIEISLFQLQQSPNCASRTTFSISFSSLRFFPWFANWHSGRCGKLGAAFRDLLKSPGSGRLAVLGRMTKQPGLQIQPNVQRLLELAQYNQLAR